MRNYQVDYKNYSFKDDDDWGDYFKGERREPWFDGDGYSQLNYFCTDGKWHTMGEHVAKWEYFNGKIPEGMQVDHIIPVKNGGTNKLSNLRLLTPKDNSNTELTKINHSNAAKKRWRNEEYKQKMSEARKNAWKEGKYQITQAFLDSCKKYREERKTPIYQYSLEWKLVGYYEGRNAAGKKTGFNRERISFHCINGKPYKGYYWRTTPI